jgi:chromosome segregation ATPase
MKKQFTLLTSTLLSLVITAFVISVASAHEGHAHATDETSSSTKVEVNSSDDKSSVRLRIENRLNSTKTIKETKEATLTERKAAFEAKLKEIKDQRKKALAERLSNQINKLNDIRTERYLRHLERLSRILEKIEKRVDELESAGKSVTSLKTSIASIKASIESTTEKVEAQQEKVYTVEIQSESTLKTDYRKVHAQLKSDLSGLSSQIKKLKDDMLTLFHDLKAQSSSSPSPTSSPT